MAETDAPEAVVKAVETETDAPEAVVNAEETETPTQDMEVEAQADDTATGDAGGVKRAREEASADEDGNDEAKKPKVEKSVEEQRLEKADEEQEEKKLDSVPEPEPVQAKVTVGAKSFESSVEMFDYFYKFLHSWTPNVNVNKYEYVMLLELLKKGHSEPDKKIGSGVHAFQIRFHPQFRSRCFFIIREDESVDDFSFRKCVNHILPLPENMQIKHDANKTLGRGRGGRGGGRGHGRGRGGRPRN